jgi:hypothetical protein
MKWSLNYHMGLWAGYEKFTNKELKRIFGHSKKATTKALEVCD